MATPAGMPGVGGSASPQRGRVGVDHHRRVGGVGHHPSSPLTPTHPRRRPPVDGRVLRLHFACRASLPLGSSLRVTSSTLWAPDSNLRGEGVVREGEAPAGSEAGEDYDRHGAEAAGKGGVGGGGEGGRLQPHASSVEMVTDPDSYPVWKTRTPVVVVANNAVGPPGGGADGAGGAAAAAIDSSGRWGVQRHRYRYMVVTPGAAASIEQTGGGERGGVGDEEERQGALAAMSAPGGGGGGARSPFEDEAMMQQDLDERTSSTAAETVEEGTTTSSVPSPRGGGGASTSNETGDGSFPVMVWEDPFGTQREPDIPDPSTSAVSLPSVRSRGTGANQQRSLVELPWRTIDVDVAALDAAAAAEATGGAPHDGDDGMGGAAEEALTTPDGVRIDRWNDPTDLSFRPYLEAEEHRTRAKIEADEAAFLAEEEELMAAAIMEEAEEEVAAVGADEADEGAGMDSSATAGDRPPAQHPGTPTPGKRVFLVCYHLPVILTRDPIDGSWSACWSESLIAKTEQSGVSSLYETQWFGTVRTVPPVSTEEEREAVRAVLRPMGCFPLFLDDEVEEQHYLGMCKQVLWPAFHNVDLLDLSASGWGQREMALNFGPSDNDVGRRAMRMVPAGNPLGNNVGSNNAGLPAATSSNTDSDWDQSRLDGWWSSYNVVNRMFAEAISAVMRPHDTIWVHDYHLTLLPKMLHDAELAAQMPSQPQGRTIQMVYFLHIPFPTSQVFRELEHGEEILEGMLHADVVGFHSFDYARHFLNASKRILGLTYESLVGGLIGVRYRGKKILVSMSNVSIESDIVSAALALPAVREGADMLRARHGRRAIVTAVDVAQRLSGVYLKLLAFERLLTDYPVWHSKVVMVQKCLIPGSRRADEVDTLANIRSIVRRIQDRFGRAVVDYEEVICSSLPIDQRLALWCASDVLVCAPVREGLNLLPLEYIYARGRGGSNGEPQNAPGVVITSEFSAISSILNGALRVNPYDTQMFVTSMDKALTMDETEREARRARDIDFVSSCSSGLWTRNVLRDLADATAAQNLDGGEGAGDGDGGGGGRMAAVPQSPSSIAAMLSQENEPEFAPLNVGSVIDAYDVTSRRVIVMDFNGTLVMKEPPGKYLKREMLGTAGNKPPPEVVRALGEMCADPRNVVFVVSGDTQRNLEDALGHIPGLGLAHSNGACFAAPLRAGEVRSQRTWHAFDLGVDWDAVKRVALPVLSKYTARTNGSFVKLTHSSIGWSYYCCDPEWGSLQASYLVPELERELRAFDVRFVTLKGVVEVVPRKLNKGLVVKKVLREVAAMHEGAAGGPGAGGKGGIDFVLCMGDDVSDEKMFTSVFSYIAESDPVGRGGGSDVVAGGASPHRPSPSSSSPNNAVMEDVSSAASGTFGAKQQSAAAAPPMYAFNVAVGKKATHASYYVNSSHDVPRLLVELTGGWRREVAGSGGAAGWTTHQSMGVGVSTSWDSMEGQARGGRFA